jgi:hypothetical protein
MTLILKLTWLSDVDCLESLFPFKNINEHLCQHRKHLPNLKRALTVK